jgi:hypothetical protein
LTILFISRCSAIVSGRKRSFCLVAKAPYSYQAVSLASVNLSDI